MIKSLEELCIEFDRPYEIIKNPYIRYESIISYYINHKIDKSKALTRDFLGENYILFMRDVDYYEFKLLKSLNLDPNQRQLLFKDKL